MKKHGFIFFGEDVFSLTVLESLVTSDTKLVPLAVVILTPISASGQKLVTYCEENKIRLIKLNSLKNDRFIRMCKKLDYDFIISAHFQRIIPSCIFSRAKIAALNLHPSLLPHYRGMSPQHWPIINRDKDTGVSVHLMEDKVDTGRIIEQVVLPISESLYIHQLQKKLLSIYESIMLTSIEKCLAGYEGEEQNDVGAEYYGKIKTSDRTILDCDSVDLAYGKIRAFSLPYAGAIFGDMIIFKANKISDKEFCSIRSTHGTGWVIVDEAAYLILKDGGLSQLKWRKNEA